MSPTALLVMGVLVTLIVGAAIALLVYAAILDGRHARAQKAAEHERAPLAGRESIPAG